MTQVARRRCTIVRCIAAVRYLQEHSLHIAISEIRIELTDEVEHGTAIISVQLQQRWYGDAIHSQQLGEERRPTVDDVDVDIVLMGTQSTDPARD